MSLAVGKAAAAAVAAASTPKGGALGATAGDDRLPGAREEGVTAPVTSHTSAGNLRCFVFEGEGKPGVSYTSTMMVDSLLI